MTHRRLRARLAAGAELVLVAVLVLYGSFSGLHVILLLLLASQSLWLRELRWADLGLRRPPSVWRVIAVATIAGLGILIGTRLIIVPVAVRATGMVVDLSTLGQPGDLGALWKWLALAWSLAAFAEEMVFRGYLMHRITDLAGDSRLGWTIALLGSSVMFGLAHRYQGWAGVIVTGSIGTLLGLFYLRSQRNLWPVIVCHGLVDTAALLAIYLDRASLLFPEIG